jgi:hypothetical protein
MVVNIYFCGFLFLFFLSGLVHPLLLSFLEKGEETKHENSACRECIMYIWVLWSLKWGM